MSNGDRFLSLDEFDDEFCARYTGFAPPAPAQAQMQQPQHNMPQHDMSQQNMLGYQQQQMPEYQMQPQYQPPQFQPTSMPQRPKPYPAPEYQAYPSELPQFDDPFLMAAQSLPAMDAAQQYPPFQTQSAPPFAPQQQWPPASPAGRYQAGPEQPAEQPVQEPKPILPPPQKDKKRLTKQLVMTGVTAAIAVLVLAAVFVPKLAFGVEFLSMNTTEMEPSIPLGSLLVIKKADYNQLKRKNVVAYEFEKGKPIIRRITRMHPETKSCSVKGDAAATSVTVSHDRMRGVLRWNMRILGYPLYLLRSTTAKIAAVVVAVLLWAAVFFLISGYGKPEEPQNGQEMPPPVERPVPPPPYS